LAPLPAAIELHRSLDGDVEVLERLASDLFEASTAATRTKAADVRAIVRKLDPTAVEGERARTFVESQRARQPR